MISATENRHQTPKGHNSSHLQKNEQEFVSGDATSKTTGKSSCESSKFQEMVEQNHDWAATCAIFGNSTTDDKEIPAHQQQCIAIRPCEIQGKIRGFYGSVYVPLLSEGSTAFTAFARQCSSQGGRYRYYTLPQTPMLCAEFKYIVQKDEEEPEQQNDDDYSTEEETLMMMMSMATPSSVTLKWIHYPDERDEWPRDEKQPFLTWIWEQSNQILKEEELSFGVCDFCAHHALAKYWKLFHEQDEYRLYMIPPKMDVTYQKNTGTLIDVEENGRHRLLYQQRQQEIETIQNKIKKRSTATTKNKCHTPITVPKKQPTNTMEYAEHALLEEWQSICHATCPICFDSTLYVDGVILPCHDFVCNECLEMYLQFKIKDIQQFRINPFTCPVETCRHAMPIVGFVKRLISSEEMETVRKWYKDLKYPPCFSLDRCLAKKTCGAMDSMRRRPNTIAQVYCDVCEKTWCELCLKRIISKDDIGNDDGEHRSVCDAAPVILFCQRYLQASEEKKKQCEAIYPWMASYAHARQHDGDAWSWLQANGQCCPTCQTGVERIEGCFHMQCPTCATHFCYECGDELYPPYYGTHHCWERETTFLGNM